MTFTYDFREEKRAQTQRIQPHGEINRMPLCLSTITTANEKKNVFSSLQSLHKIISN